MSSGSICINQPHFVNHTLCYGRMYGDIQEECPYCLEKPKCVELTDQYHQREEKPIRQKKPKRKVEVENIYIAGVK